MDFGWCVDGVWRVPKNMRHNPNRRRVVSLLSVFSVFFSSVVPENDERVGSDTTAHRHPRLPPRHGPGLRDASPAPGKLPRTVRRRRSGDLRDEDPGRHDPRQIPDGTGRQRPLHQGARRGPPRRRSGHLRPLHERRSHLAPRRHRPPLQPGARDHQRRLHLQRRQRDLSEGPPRRQRHRDRLAETTVAADEHQSHPEVRQFPGQRADPPAQTGRRSGGRHPPRHRGTQPDVHGEMRHQRARLGRDAARRGAGSHRDSVSVGRRTGVEIPRCAQSYGHARLRQLRTGVSGGSGRELQDAHRGAGENSGGGDGVQGAHRHAGRIAEI
mmetsp:Transcript_8757/g.19258  ORF Transcript_8757/g.19258 Transcript_8757/m.19258 type:complete len:326 (+) Transcript_8757:315-1292(+)